MIRNSGVFASASNVCTCAISALDVIALGVHVRDVATRDWKQTGHGRFLFQSVPTSVSFESGDQLRNSGKE